MVCHVEEDSNIGKIVEDSVDITSHGKNDAIVISPGNTRYYIPDCDSSLRPLIGQQFSTLDLGIDFHRRYAAACGFDIRLDSQKRSRDDVIIWKYVFCNREGEKNVPGAKDVQVSEDIGVASDDIQEKVTRRKLSKRFGCKAFIVFRLVGGVGYDIFRFEEKHTHPLCADYFRQFLNINKNVNPGHQNFIVNCAKVNIGAMKSFRLYKKCVGGYENIGCLGVDFKNFSRDLKAYAIGFDAQMLLDNLHKKRGISDGFFFEYQVDENDHLCRLFWADTICRRNYAVFGDVVSFGRPKTMATSAGSTCSRSCFNFIIHDLGSKLSNNQ